MYHENGCGHHHEEGECCHSHEHEDGECCHGHGHEEGECCHSHEHEDGECCHGHGHEEEHHCGHHHEGGHHCGHHHHHGGDQGQVMVGTMSGHLVGTMSAVTTYSIEIAEMNMNLSMKDVSLFIHQAGGIPMQIKASCKNNLRTVVMNMMGTDIYRSEQNESAYSEEGKVKLNLLVLANGADPQALRGKLEEIRNYFEKKAF